MKTLIGVELAIGGIVGLAFIIAYASAAWGNSPAGRHMMAVSAVMAGEALALLLILLGVPLPLWVFALAYGAADLVVIHRLVLLYRARHEDKGGKT